MRQAVFIVIKNENDQILCVTRPSEKAKYEGDFGLPGGMVEESETLIEAMQREALEEGIDIIHLNPSFIYTCIYEERNLQVYWFLGKGSFTKGEYKEQHRISPVYKTKEELSLTTYGNRSVMQLIF